MTEQELEQEAIVKQERFCSWCGLSLLPLSGNISCYALRNCTECGKTIYTPPAPAANGQGLVINAGETHHFIIEPFSLSPRRRSFFTRHGILLTVKMLLSAGEPKSEAELEASLKFYKDKAELFLKNSPLLDELDFDNENHAEEICTRLTQDKDRREFFAFKMLALSQITEKAIAENNVRQAAWAMYHIAIAHCFFEVGDFDFEETLWQGHQAHIFLTKVQDASVQTPAQAQAIEKLQPLFERQTEITLHTWVEDEKLIGERIGVSGLPEETLRAMAKYYLKQFERNRQDALQTKEDKRKEEEARRQELTVWNPVRIACITGFAAIVVAFINFMTKFIPPR